jgi:hypothetical protein
MKPGSILVRKRKCGDNAVDAPEDKRLRLEGVQEMLGFRKVKQMGDTKKKVIKTLLRSDEAVGVLSG